MATNINIIRDVTPCSLVHRYQYFEGTCCRHLQDIEMETGGSCEILVTMYQITRGRAPEDDSILHRHRVMASDLTNI
jgi:hypothetical protein